MTGQVLDALVKIGLPSTHEIISRCEKDLRIFLEEIRKKRYK